MKSQTLPVSSVVNVQVLLGPRAASSRNFGAMLIAGTSDVISPAERIREYFDIQGVLEDFGTEAPEYHCAQVFFSQEPKPRSVLIGRWAKNQTSAMVLGKPLSQEEQAISNFTTFAGYSKGSLNITVDSQPLNVTDIDLSRETNLNGVASKITEKLQSKATLTWDGQRFILKAQSSGKASNIKVRKEGGPNPLGQVLGLFSRAFPTGLGDTGGITIVGGQDSETVESAVAEFLDSPSWYGLLWSEHLEDNQAVAVAGMISASELKHVVGFTSMNPKEMDGTATDTLGYKLKAKGFNRAIVQYSSDNPHAVASIFGRMSTVNFKGRNTTITLKFKQEPSVVAEGLRASQALALQKKNVNVFAKYNNDTAILQEGVTSGGAFIDEIHGLDWLENTIQTAVYNLLYTSSTKVGQTDPDMNIIVSVINEVLDKASGNGLIASGVWKGDEFGSLKRGDVLPSGYYVFIESVDDQLQEDREARKAPPVMIAVKMRGAVHFVDVIIRVNR